MVVAASGEVGGGVGGTPGPMARGLEEAIAAAATQRLKDNCCCFAR